MLVKPFHGWRRCCQTLPADLDQEFITPNALADGDVEHLDNASERGVDLVFHFHSFQGQQGLSGRYPVARCHHEPDNQAGNGSF
jgi:hypothetical protein